jgi:hypothetical protein
MAFGTRNEFLVLRPTEKSCVERREVLNDVGMRNSEKKSDPLKSKE